MDFKKYTGHNGNYQHLYSTYEDIDFPGRYFCSTLTANIENTTTAVGFNFEVGRFPFSSGAPDLYPLLEVKKIYTDDGTLFEIGNYTDFELGY